MIHEKKINSEGEYVPFAGITVICPLVTDISEFHTTYAKFIDKRGYSVLPLDSMHMTLKNLWTAGKFKSIEEYNAFLRERKASLDILKSRLKMKGRVTMNVVQCYGTGLHLQPASYEDALMINDCENIVDFSLPFDGLPIVKKHMTMAYQYANVEVDMVKFQKVLEKMPKQLVFDIPMVTTFSDMTRYIET